MIAWFTRNGVAANLVMLILIIGGVASYLTVKRELFPKFSLDLVTVRVPYLGASPEEVEESVEEMMVVVETWRHSVLQKSEHY